MATKHNRKKSSTTSPKNKGAAPATSSQSLVESPPVPVAEHQLTLPWNAEFIPHLPTPKQLAFLMLPHKEAFYGGAAGGGKSDALLMAALQYVHVPGYAAILFRKTLTELKLPGSLLDRAHSWLSNTSAQYVAGEHTYYFPTRSPYGGWGEPAKVSFGYIGQESAKSRYQSAEFQFVGFDELTHYDESDFLWMHSRLRKSLCSKHTEKEEVIENGVVKHLPIYEPDCPECQLKQLTPTRIRGASNPGNIGHDWVKKRFGIEPIVVDGAQRYVGTIPDRPFIPARVEDNKHIDQAGYIDSLDQMDAITRAQMREGDWGASKDARFKAEWFARRRYTLRNGFYLLGGDAKIGIRRDDFMKVFSVIDPAASSKEGPGDIDRWKIPNNSFTVITTWGLTQDYQLLLIDMVRVSVEAPNIPKLVRNVFKTHKPQYIICEATGIGKAVYQALVHAGFPVKPIYPHQDKLQRSVEAQIRAERGYIWLPADPAPPWMREVEGELFVWTGHVRERDDIIDNFSYAATDVTWEAAGIERSEDEELTEIIGDDFAPGIVGNPYDSIEEGPILDYTGLTPTWPTFNY